MQNIKNLLASKEIRKNGAPQKKIYGWSYYGDLTCKLFNLDAKYRNQLMRYFMLKGDSFASTLYDLAQRLNDSGRLPMYPQDKVRYFLGSVKRM